MTARETIVIFDFDKTISRHDSYVFFLLFILLKKPQRIIRALWLPLALLLHKLKFYDNTWLKCTFLQSIAAGLPKKDVMRLAQDYAAILLARDIRTEARKEIQRHRDLGNTIILASASYDIYMHYIADSLSMNLICTHAIWDEHDCLLGAIAGKNCYGQQKLAALQAVIPPRDTVHVIAYSDDHSDIPLLTWADEGIAVCPSKTLRKAAELHHWPVKNWH